MINKKPFIILLAIILISTSCNLAAGSYPYAELYEFNVDEETIIESVNKFKIENPEYKLPENIRFIDGKLNKQDQWHHCWFYYANENKIVKCWVRGNKIGLVGIGTGLNLDNYKEVNNDYSRKENKKEKGKFEKLILNKIRNYTN
jgi:hypothetical protein